MEPQLKSYVDAMLREIAATYATREAELCSSVEMRLVREDRLLAERRGLSKV